MTARVARLVSFVAPMIALAGPADPAAAQVPAEARLEFDRATQLYEDGRYDDAAAAFEALLARYPSPEMRYNAFRSQLQAGALAAAVAHLRIYVSEAPDSAETARLRNQLHDLERRLAEQQAAAEQAASEPTEPTESLQERESPTVAAEAPTPWAAIGVGAAGLVVLAAGGVTGALALSDRGALEDACDESRCPESEGSRIDRLRALAIATDIAFIAGGALVITSLILLAVGPGSDDEPPTDLAVAVAPNGAAIAWESHF